MHAAGGLEVDLQCSRCTRSVCTCTVPGACCACASACADRDEYTRRQCTLVCAAGLSGPAASARCPGWSKRAHTVARSPPTPGRVHAVYVQCTRAVHMLRVRLGAWRLAHLFIATQELRCRLRLGLGGYGGRRHGRGRVGVDAQRCGTTLLSCLRVERARLAFGVMHHSVEHAAHDGHAGRKRRFGQR